MRKEEDSLRLLIALMSELASDVNFGIDPGTVLRGGSLLARESSYCGGSLCLVGKSANRAMWVCLKKGDPKNCRSFPWFLFKPHPPKRVPSLKTREHRALPSTFHPASWICWRNSSSVSSTSDSKAISWTRSLWTRSPRPNPF